MRPKTVRLDDGRVIVEWSDGHVSLFTYLNLREACPCALCRGEANPFGGPGVMPVVPAVPSDVRPLAHTLVGLYAIAFTWSDGHNTGIYPYDYLLSLCECEKCAKGVSA